MMNPDATKPSLLDTPLKRWFPANMETLLAILILVVGAISRFSNLGAMTIAFDEVNHVVPAFDLYSGRGYRYDPLSHGPFQFHGMALSYAMFGDNDFTTRIPVAVFSTAAIGLALFAFRRYLGRAGALVAGVLMLISPYMLFYGRYQRNETFIVMWALLTIYAILRYLEKGETRILILFTLVNAFHFSDKVTSYMFAGAELLFLAAYVVDRLARRKWDDERQRTYFLFGLVLTVVLMAIAGLLYVTQKPLDGPMKVIVGILGAGGLGTLVWAGVAAEHGLGWGNLRSERALSLLILLGTFVLPLLGAIPISLLNLILTKFSKPTIDMLAYTAPHTIEAVAGAVVLLGGIGVLVGLWWFGRKWLLQAALFFVPFTLLYTAFMTNPDGLVGGLVGALSYWIVQQGVARGGQPGFYYALLQIPMYEFLPALGTIVAVVIAAAKRLWRASPGEPFSAPRTEEGQLQSVPTATLLVYWSVAMLALFTYAGEKMPWLTIHIALPMILAAAWAIGWLVEQVPWGRLAAWGFRNYARVALLAFFGLLAVITGRAAFRAAYINYDYPLEYLVYAHDSQYAKIIYNEIIELSLRTAGGTQMVAAYDNKVRYPFWWYMRRYSNKIDFDVNPSRELRNAVVIAVGDTNVSKLTPVVRDNYYDFHYMLLWWQNQDYWSLKWDRIESERNAAVAQTYSQNEQDVPPMTLGEYFKYAWPHIQPFFTDPVVRNAVWQIWFNRDYTAWAAIQGNDSYTLTDWGVSEAMHYYIRKDIGQLLWPYGAEAVPVVPPADPYAAITVTASPDLIMGAPGSDAGLFNTPHGIAVAPDGSLYVADSLNHRIQHIGLDSAVLQVWGSYADASQQNAPGGTFNEPWGVAVGPDGSVYVADTWNHRIQKFTAEGEFITMWGSFGQGDTPEAFYGPRGVAVDGQGHVYVADTGNKRIVVFDSNGGYITQFGGFGMALGQLDEPVDVALDSYGNVYVTDTWNQRVEVFAPQPGGLDYVAIAEWPVDGWYDQGIENKPFVALDTSGDVSVTDPQSCRIITFSQTGQPVRVLDGCTGGAFQTPSGITSDGNGGLWITDAANGTLVHLPAITPQSP
jgi:predicted membrane-bound mannosyltransferase/DNA-binding beta-propeller fold protein YncE